MTKSTTLLLIALSLLTPASYGGNTQHKKDQSTTLGDFFNDGWKVGWKAGWKQVNGQYSYPPYPPFPPFPLSPSMDKMTSKEATMQDF
jgi:hypothetical protein